MISVWSSVPKSSPRPGGCCAARRAARRSRPWSAATTAWLATCTRRSAPSRRRTAPAWPPSAGRTPGCRGSRRPRLPLRAYTPTTVNSRSSIRMLRPTAPPSGNSRLAGRSPEHDHLPPERLVLGGEQPALLGGVVVDALVHRRDARTRRGWPAPGRTRRPALRRSAAAPRRSPPAGRDGVEVGLGQGPVGRRLRCRRAARRTRRRA